MLTVNLSKSLIFMLWLPWLDCQLIVFNRTFVLCSTPPYISLSISELGYQSKLTRIIPREVHFTYHGCWIFPLRIPKLLYRTTQASINFSWEWVTSFNMKGAGMQYGKAGGSSLGEVLLERWTTMRDDFFTKGANSVYIYQGATIFKKLREATACKSRESARKC